MIPPEASGRHQQAATIVRILATKAAGLVIVALLLAASLSNLNNIITSAHAISIKPADFDRLIMPCYLGAGSGQSAGPGGAPGASYSYAGQQQAAPLAQNPLGQSQATQPNSINSNTYTAAQFGRQTTTNGGATGYQPPTYYGAESGRPSSSAIGGGPSSLVGRANEAGLSSLGQTVPRANTIDNFIALVTKIEMANPRLANNPDQLIRSLLARFRLDNYYYDVRSRTPISEQDRRVNDILPALFNTIGGGQQQQSQYINSDLFPEHLLDHNEKCSMYFMLSHFIDKTSPMSPTLGQTPVNQLAGPQYGQRPPVLQAAGAGYPAQSANQAYSGAGASGGARYPGPSPSFGSPATSNMNAFGTGISNSPEYSGRNPYGMNAAQPSNQYNQPNSGRNGAQLGASQLYSSNPRPIAPYIDAMGRQRDERVAIEYGVVTLVNQDNAALVLNRVLLGLLAATTPPQTIRQLAAIIYPTQSIMLNTPKIDEEIDPLFAVTLADLWAISSIPKSGKPFDIRMLGDNGHWNDTMCPTTFTLERSSSIRFTTAELLGGIDGFNLGTLRRRLLSNRSRNIKLSEMLRMYYSRSGFRPNYAEVGVCSRQAGLGNSLDELHRQAENYLRLYQLNLPSTDNDIALSINRLETFKETARQAANQYTPQDICQETSFDLYPMSQQDQCEIAKADVVTVLDTSVQANTPFMHLVVTKLAQKLGLSREGSSFSVMTNQQDTTGYGAYGFNAIVRNSTNTAEIGCALVYDTTQTYQGGHITDQTKLMEMFEQALVKLDSEYLTRQTVGGISSSSSTSSVSYSYSYSSSNRPSYISSWFGQSDYGGNYLRGGGGPRNSGGAKVIIWFNFGPQTRPAQSAAMPTNWNGPNYPEQNKYRFYEAKKYLRENFRGASILAVTSNRDDVKSFVYDEDRDIFTDIPPGSGSSINSISSSDYYPTSSSDASSIAMLSGPADQLVSKLLQRMCTIPAVFQYPMCFSMPSNNEMTAGYISPGRKQYWMMSPKTFFASRSVRIVFKIDGGRLRVCFGRKPNPDETAMRNSNNNQQYQPSSISFNFGNPSGGPSQPTPSPTPSSSDYYTGLDFGICKDVSPGQEIDFLISDPCYKKAIADCEPFYFIIRETSNPGEGDPNYMCRDDGCKRLDQAKFIMTHTGVTCSSAFKALQANRVLIMISAIIAIYFTNDIPFKNKLKIIQRPLSNYKSIHLVVASVTIAFCTIVQQVKADVYDFGQVRSGERRGSFTPPEVLAIILVIMVLLAGLTMAIGLCYYVTKRPRRGMKAVDQDGY